MKRALTVASILVAGCVFASVANSQRSAITQEEYEKAINSAVDLSETRIRRVTILIETRTKEGRVTSKARHVEEYIPPELSRFVDTITSGDVSSTEEIIQIGRFGYQKKDRAPWTGSPYRSVVLNVLNRSSGACGRPDENQCSHASQQALLDGNAVRMFSRTGEDEYDRESMKVWVSHEGILLRTELIETSRPSPEGTQTTTSTWEYDPADLEIKAPQN